MKLSYYLKLLNRNKKVQVSDTTGVDFSTTVGIKKNQKRKRNDWSWNNVINLFVALRFRIFYIFSNLLPFVCRPSVLAQVNLP